MQWSHGVWTTTGSSLELGTDHIRIMPIWSDFQPKTRMANDAHLERLDQLMILADLPVRSRLLSSAVWCISRSRHCAAEVRT